MRFVRVVSRFPILRISQKLRSLTERRQIKRGTGREGTRHQAGPGTAFAHGTATWDCRTQLPGPLAVAHAQANALAAAG